jgi:hypothetical protein
MRNTLLAIAAAGVLMPAVAIAETPGGLVTKWNELNLLCKSGPRDDPKADCERRNEVEALTGKTWLQICHLHQRASSRRMDLQSQKENEMKKTLIAIAAVAGSTG